MRVWPGLEQPALQELLNSFFAIVSVAPPALSSQILSSPAFSSAALGRGPGDAGIDLLAVPQR